MGQSGKCPLSNEQLQALVDEVEKKEGSWVGWDEGFTVSPGFLELYRATRLKDIEEFLQDSVRVQDAIEGMTGIKLRKFDTGATRDTDENKLDFEGFLSPAVLERYAEYMHKNRVQADGETRASDNWQKGIPKDAYMESAWRHFFDWWKSHRAGAPDQEAMCALLFNVMGYLFEDLREEVEAAGRGVPF